MIRRHEFVKDSKRKYRNERTTQTYEDKTEKELEIQLPYHEKKSKKTGQYKISSKVFSVEGSLDPALSSETTLLYIRLTMKNLIGREDSINSQ